MDTQTIITIITKIVLPVCGAIITYFIIPWIKAKIGDEKFKTIMSWVYRAVEAAEQIFPAGDNSSKYEYAVNLIKAQAKKHGVELTDEEIRTLIESAVSVLPDTHVAE